ncbi:MBL fold metallo-hydrolase [Kitasatospora sp. NPDC002227]|uniref:MBL fold metallo-hydrolase n=1 Tax=Kitasatospora sp. NPDC002227 TaxID=3154773 RepID=UPI003332153E
MVNASPDLRVQLLAAPELTPPPGTRDTPLRGVLLTSGELDHTLGLLTLREAAGLTVHATDPVRRALHSAFPVGPLLAPYTKADWRTVTPGRAVELDGGLVAEPLALGTKRPRYAADLPEHPAWVTGYRFTQTAGPACAVYAPGLAQWTPALELAVRTADLVLLDGTYDGPDEPTAAVGGAGHLAVQHSLPHLARHRGPRHLYTHLNNTNPLNHATTPALTAAGAAVAAEGMLIELPGAPKSA